MQTALSYLRSLKWAVCVVGWDVHTRVCVGGQGTTLGIVLTSHLVLSYVTVEARLAILQALRKSPVFLPSQHRSAEVTDVHCSPAVHGFQGFELRPLCLHGQVLDSPLNASVE